MTSVQSSLDADPDEVDLSGLVESIVDSDEEEDLAESMDVSIIIVYLFYCFLEMHWILMFIVVIF